MKAIAYIGIFNEVVQSPAYHGFGWTKATVGQLEMKGYQVDILTADEVDMMLDQYDEIYIDEGVNFEDKKWNKIGGDFIKTSTKIVALSKWKGKIWHNALKPFPTYKDLSDKRGIEEIDWTGKEIAPIDFIAWSDKLVIGDSHATSVWEPRWALHSTNGRTLYSMIGEGIDSIVPKHIRRVRLYAGNIDIRFHLHRLDVDLKDYSKSLFLQLKKPRERGVGVEVVQPLPIESEERQIPTTGRYKGKNFYGTWEERNEIRTQIDSYWRTLCKKIGASYITWPDTFVDVTGKLRFEVMEPKSSVHLSPKKYAYKINHIL